MARIAMPRWEDLKDLACSAYFLHIISIRGYISIRVYLGAKISGNCGARGAEREPVVARGEQVQRWSEFKRSGLFLLESEGNLQLPTSDCKRRKISKFDLNFLYYNI